MLMPCTVWTPSWGTLDPVSIVYRLDHARHVRLQDAVDAIRAKEAPLELWQQAQALRDEVAGLPTNLRGETRKAQIVSELAALAARGCPDAEPVRDDAQRRHELIGAACVCLERVRVAGEDHILPSGDDARAEFFAVFTTPRLFHIVLGMVQGLSDPPGKA
jgi:hypothetical protein